MMSFWSFMTRSRKKMTTSSHYKRKPSSGKTQALDPPRVPDERPGVPGGVRDVNRRRRVEEIGRAALDLFLERGVADVTVDEVVVRADIAKGSFYRYFRDLEDLVDAMLRPLSERFRGALDDCATG